MERAENQYLVVEPRRMTRRQLLQALLAVAAAPTLPYRVEAAPAFKPVWLNQYTYIAPDMQATADWYIDVFGMQRGMVSARETHLWFGDVQGDTLMIVQQAQANDHAPAITRFGFTINYWDRDFVQAELEQRGLNPQAETTRGFWFQDPEGNEIGVFAPDWLPRPVSPPAGPAVLQALSANHIVVVSSDYKKLASWYHDLIALNQTTDSGRDVVQWFGDTAWLPTQVREGGQTSAALKTFDHCALTVADYNTRTVVQAMKRHGIIPQSQEIAHDDTGIYGVDLNNFKIQVCAWNEAPNQDRRRLRLSRQRGD